MVDSDGFQVYDIQDESSRSGEKRPFPFSATYNPSFYAQVVRSNSEIIAEPIIYKALTPNHSKEDFIQWLKNCVENCHIKCIVLVGGASGDHSMTVLEAAKIVQELYPNRLVLGGITIPERHRDKGDEPLRLVEKTKAGLQFFTSQVVYNADNAISALRHYDEYVKELGMEPSRIIFTFAPFCSDNTVQFLKWLGVELPFGTVKRVLSRPNVQSRVEEANEICWENWKRILDAITRLNIRVPIGFGVESVTKSKIEQDAAIKLFKELKMEMNIYYKKNKLY